MLEGERSYQRGQGNLVPSDNTSSIPESQVVPKAQEKPWYIQHFTKLLIGFGLGGGAVAILLPWMLWLLRGMSSGSSDQLRLHLLYVTGGVIAVLTLLQTNWKNQGDRLKIDADIKKNEQDAKNEAAKREQDAVKSERDHTRQVHAERRSRYTTAVGQLADEKVAIRLGGIYTLTGLIDEWLADSTLNEEEQQKEGQVIINNLCSYIRSPFPLAEKREVLEEDQVPDDYNGNFTADRALLRGEQDVRRTIFEEMNKRSSTVSVEENKEVTVTPGPWSGFKFDFSRALIFYPLNNLTIEQGNFASTRFYGEANFRGAKFTEAADFGDAKFTRNAHFRNAKFTRNADFRNAKFTRNADFRNAKFTRNADFGGAKFTGKTYFWGTEFTGNAYFGGAKFTGDTNFGDTSFGAGKFTGDAYFWGAEFTGNAYFGGAKFTGNAYFGGTKFTGNADFERAEFTRYAYYGDAEFTENTSFNGAYFKQYAPVFANDSDSARFSAQVNPQYYVFSVNESSKPVKCETATLLGKSFIIPLGTVLFDPDSWDEEKQEYTHVSDPVKPLDNSSDGEEGKSA